MKNLFVALVTVLVTTFSAVAAGPGNGTETVEIATTAQCGMCKASIEEALMAQKGVKFAELDLETKKVKVVYNTKRTELADIKTAITMVGYAADDMAANEAAYAKLAKCCQSQAKACCKKSGASCSKGAAASCAKSKASCSGHAEKGANHQH